MIMQLSSCVGNHYAIKVNLARPQEASNAVVGRLDIYLKGLKGNLSLLAKEYVIDTRIYAVETKLYHDGIPYPTHLGLITQKEDSVGVLIDLINEYI